VRQYEAFYGDLAPRARSREGALAVMSRIRNAVPWWLRIGAKIILARLPVDYSVWKRLRLFEHGDMNQPEKALHTFLEHAKTGDVLDTKGQVPRLKATNDGFTVLELGPGDSLFTAMIARALGASRTWLVDTGPFATTDMNAYMSLFNYLQQRGIAVPCATNQENTDEILKACDGDYMTDGVSSLAKLTVNSVDYCFSNAVLEHVPRDHFAMLAAELFRVMKPGGVSVHRVDLKDHLGGGLNNLRFSEATWEGPLFRNSGFYTNRVRFGEMLVIFERAGFDCRLPRIVHWERLPTPRSKMDAQFSCLPNEDLRVSGFDIVLRVREKCVV